MPRKQPLPESEIEVGRRLRQTRKAWRGSRLFLANRAGLDSSVIIRVELGRSRLKYEAARNILPWLNLNARWLATGLGSRTPYFPLPPAADLGVAEDAAFTDVFHAHIAKYITPTTDATAPLEALPHNAFGRWINCLSLKGHAETWFTFVPDSHVKKLSRALFECGKAFLAACPRDKWNVLLERRRVMAAFKARTQTGDKPVEESEKTLLTATSLKRTVGPVKIRTLRDLLTALRAKTSEKGAKAALAKDLKVPHARVSEWLSGKKRPGGETTLRLLHWVQQAEAQQTKNPAGAITPTGLKTQPQQSKSYETPKSNPQKR